MPEPLKAILFDVGNVLVRLRTQDFLDGLQAACPGLTPERMLVELREEGPHHAYERGEIQGPDFHAHLVKAYGLNWDYAAWLRHWNNYFLPNRPMEVTLAKIQGQVKFWGLSNTNLEHWTHFRREFRLFDGFEAVIGSHELGLRKPQPAIYEAALKRMGLPAPAVLFVDDLEDNVKAARQAGMLGFHYQFNDLEFKAHLQELGLQFEEWGSRPSPFAC